MKKRIAIVSPYGAEPRLDNYAEFIFAQELGERGYDVHFYTYADRVNPAYQSDSLYKGVRVYRCRQRFGISPRLFLSILMFKPNAVVTFHPRSMLTFSAWLAARSIGAKFIAEVVGILHDPFVVRDVDDPREFIEPSILITRFADVLKSPTKDAWTNYVCHAPVAAADTVIAINRDEKMHVERLYKRSAEVVYWCAPKVAPRTEKPAQELPEKYILFIGQIKRRKGWDTALSALAALRRTRSDARLVFVTPNASYGEAIELAKRLDIERNVTFLQSISNEEKQWLYAHAEAVWVPSTYEGFGLPIFEAFLADVPVIASDIPVFREFLVSGTNALLFPVGDAEALAHGTEQLIRNGELRARLVSGGRETASRFSPKRMVDAMLSLIVN